MRQLFNDARNEVFEDGMDSNFANALYCFVREHGTAAVDALETVMRMSDVNAEIAEEALMQTGYMKDEATHQGRLSLLIRALESSNARIRDAASVGIEAMDDPTASHSLQKAIAREQYGPLRQNFKDVLAQLQDGH